MVLQGERSKAAHLPGALLMFLVWYLLRSVLPTATITPCPTLCTQGCAGSHFNVPGYNQSFYFVNYEQLGRAGQKSAGRSVRKT